MNQTKTLRNGVAALAIAGVAGIFLVQGGSAAFAHDKHDKHEKNGKVTSEVRDVAAFSRIQVRGGLELDLTAGKDQHVEISAREGFLKDVKTYVRGDTLVIDMDDDDDDDDNHGHHMSFDGDDSVKVTITLPMLEEFEVMGAVDGNLHNLNSKGAGDVDAEELKCADVEVDVRGVGEARVFASESVDANVSGVGSITVYGDPKKVRQSDGFLGSIRIK